MTVTAPRPRTVAPPEARGPLSDAVLQRLSGGEAPFPAAGDADPWGDDLQLALYLSYELHYRGDSDLEWDPALLGLRREMERGFLSAVRCELDGGDDVEAALAPLLLEPVHGTGPSWHLARRGTREQLREYTAHRSLYHLKEADPQAFVVGRLEGQAKAALVTVQHDEYGAGRAERMHATLFAAAMRELDLDDGYGAYLDAAPAVTLAPVNLMSLFGLHRALRGAAYGQFVLIEVTSPPGSRRLSRAFARLSDGTAGQRFYDEHIEADAVHEQLLRAGLADLLAREPQLAADVVLGLQAGSLLEERFGAHLLSAWGEGRTSLCRPLDADATR